MRTVIYVLFGYLVLFALFFAVAVWDYVHNIPLLPFGSAKITNLFLIALSVIGIGKTVIYLYKIEHPKSAKH